MAEIALTNGGVARVNQSSLHLLLPYRWRRFDRPYTSYALHFFGEFARLNKIRLKK